MPPIGNPLFAKYKLACTHPGCAGTKIIDEAGTAGLQIGDIVPDNPHDDQYGRCPRCKRTKMRVIEGPPGPAPKLPVGWNKIPDK